MPAIHIKAFGGLKPILDPLLLRQDEAQTASNVRLVSGALSTLAGLAWSIVDKRPAPQARP